MKRSAFVLLVLAACADDPAEPARFGNENGGAPDLVPDDGPRPQGLRRMTVDELQASVSVVAGADIHGAPIRWEVDLGNGPVDGYDDEGLGRMLGRPDFVSSTEEDGAPGVLYLKFVADMAQSVCGRMVENDVQRPAGTATLWRHAPHTTAPTEAELTANLRYLLLRFLGVRADTGNDLLEGYRTLYEAAAATYPGSPWTPEVEGWRAVCIALFEDPAFHIH